MRIALLHNSSAGSEDHTDRELARVLGKAGHHVTTVVSSLNQLTRALQEGPCDLVVVAGGDGTVGRVACELAGWKVPLSILPFGTANNTAHALQLPLRAKQLAKSWHRASAVPFDLGLFSDGILRSRFAEVAGWGVFAQAIAQAKREDPEEGIVRTLRRDRKIFRHVAERLPVRHYDIEADGRDHSGEYLLVELMNVGYLGPRLELSPHSDPGDGQLELLLLGEADRVDLVEASRSGKVDPARWQPLRAAQIRVSSDDGLLHRDGHLLRQAPGRRTFEIEVEPGAVAYLR